MFRRKNRKKKPVIDAEITKKSKITPFHRNPFYQMHDKTAVSLVIDYAKHKNRTYEVIIFEFQNTSHSVLNIHPKSMKKYRIKLLQRVLPKNTSFVDRHSVYSFDTLFDEVFNLLRLKSNEVRKEYQAPTLNEALDMIEYQLLEYDFLANPKEPYKTKYKPDYVLRSFNSNKIIQRLWLNSIPEGQQFLPQKVMILSHHDFKNVDELTDSIIDCFGLNSEIFLKGSRGANGNQNLHVHIENPSVLKKKLQLFQQYLKFPKLALVESASHIGKSADKKTISNYRVLGTLIHENDTENQFCMINLWRSLSKKNHLDSHQHEQTDYFAESEPVSIIHQDNGSTTQLPLSREKTMKHLSLNESKPELFNLFSLLLFRLTTIDFSRVFNAAPVWKNEQTAKKVFYLSKKTKALSVKENIRLFTESTNKQKAFNKSLAPIMARAKIIEPRDWYFMAFVAMMILITTNHSNLRENSKKINEIIFEPSTKKAYKKAEQMMSYYRPHGFYAVSTDALKNQDIISKALTIRPSGRSSIRKRIN